MSKHENKKFPYKPARFVDGVNKYVVFWIWDNETKKLVRKRLYTNASQKLADQSPSKIEIIIAEKTN